MQEDYLIVNESTIEDLEREVKDYIDIGWMVIGGVSSFHDTSIHFTQAMIKIVNN